LIRETRVSRVTPPNGGKSGLLSRDDRLCITCRGERAVRSKECWLMSIFARRCCRAARVDARALLAWHYFSARPPRPLQKNPCD